jgi:hypothetical protein
MSSNLNTLNTRMTNPVTYRVTYYRDPVNPSNTVLVVLRNLNSVNTVAIQPIAPGGDPAQRITESLGFTTTMSTTTFNALAKGGLANFGGEGGTRIDPAELERVVNTSGIGPVLKFLEKAGGVLDKTELAYDVGKQVFVEKDYGRGAYTAVTGALRIKAVDALAGTAIRGSLAIINVGSKFGPWGFIGSAVIAGLGSAYVIIKADNIASELSDKAYDYFNNDLQKVPGISPPNIIVTARPTLSQRKVYITQEVAEKYVDPNTIPEVKDYLEGRRDTISVPGIVGIEIDPYPSGGVAVTRDGQIKRFSGDPLDEGFREKNSAKILNAIKYQHSFGAVIFDTLSILDLGEIGSILGSTISRQLTSDPFGRVLADGVLRTVGGAVGEFLDENIFGGTSTVGLLDNGLEGLALGLVDNLKTAGVGAISSFLVAELLDEVGLGGDGIVGEWYQTILGARLAALIAELPAIIAGTKRIVDVWNGVNGVNIFGSFVGAKLGSAIVSFDTIGGQIGASVGSAVGTLIAAKLIGTGTTILGAELGKVLGVAIAGPVGALIGAALGYIIDGVIGSLFGGTPRSSAEVVWDAEQGRFEVANAASRKNGSKDAAIGIAGNVAEAYNGVLSAVGGKLLAAEGVQAGNYGCSLACRTSPSGWRGAMCISSARWPRRWHRPVAAGRPASAAGLRCRRCWGTSQQRRTMRAICKTPLRSTR